MGEDNSAFHRGPDMLERIPFSRLAGMIAIAAAGAMTAGGASAQTTKVAQSSSHSMNNYKKPSDDSLKKELTPLQYEVTQHEATERPFQNAYWDNHEPGIYVDVVSGEPLFSSTDKYDSGTGWPSFTKPLVPDNIATKSDRTLGMVRTEVRSAHADSHLGHLFDDGPRPTGMRYCMNSASMRFIPASKLVEEGYGQYAYLFTAPAKK
jgi:peptide-methionine (R)-S-oxide reductase